jgi:hypothetical protein
MTRIIVDVDSDLWRYRGRVKVGDKDATARFLDDQTFGNQYGQCLAHNIAAD